MKAILRDGTVLPVSDATLEPHFWMDLPDRKALEDVWDKLTPAALDEVSFYKEDVLVARFTACEITNIQLILSYDGSMTAHFYLWGEPQESISREYKDAYETVVGGKA